MALLDCLVDDSQYWVLKQDCGVEILKQPDLEPEVGDMGEGRGRAGAGLSGGRLTVLGARRGLRG